MQHLGACRGSALPSPNLLSIVKKVAKHLQDGVFLNNYTVRRDLTALSYVLCILLATLQIMTAYVDFQARKLPPLGLMISMVENTARKFADRAHLGEGAYNNVTPFASKLLETEREASKG